MAHTKGRNTNQNAANSGAPSQSTIVLNTRTGAGETASTDSIDPQQGHRPELETAPPTEAETTPEGIAAGVPDDFDHERIAPVGPRRDVISLRTTVALQALHGHTLEDEVRERVVDETLRRYRHPDPGRKQFKSDIGLLKTSRGIAALVLFCKDSPLVTDAELAAANQARNPGEAGQPKAWTRRELGRAMKAKRQSDGETLEMHVARGRRIIAAAKRFGLLSESTTPSASGRPASNGPKHLEATPLLLDFLQEVGLRIADTRYDTTG